MSKSLVTNLVALVLTVIGFLKPFDSSLILMIGLFSLSGGITNWLAIHMLFEKIPFIYGSGIIPINFKLLYCQSLNCQPLNFKSLNCKSLI